jgi:hypothetical protein
MHAHATPAQQEGWVSFAPMPDHCDLVCSVLLLLRLCPDPHGILILSRVAMYGKSFDTLFPGVETRVLAASPMFYLPGAREICLWMGAVSSASRV